MTIKPVKQGYNRFCGPAALSILTGRSTDECASIIQAIEKTLDVQGVKLETMLKACQKLRMKTEMVPTTEGASLFYVLSLLAKNEGIYLIMIKRHYVVIEITVKKNPVNPKYPESKILLCDNHTKEPLDAAGSARLGSTCLACYRITIKPEPKLIREELAIQVTPYRLFINLIKMYEDTSDNEHLAIGSVQNIDKPMLKRLGQMLIDL